MTGCGACSTNCWICSHATQVPGVLSSPAPVLFLGRADLSAFRQECGCHGVSSSLIVRICIYSRASRLPVTGHRFSVMRFCWPPFGHLIATPPLLLLLRWWMAILAPEWLHFCSPFALSSAVMAHAMLALELPCPLFPRSSWEHTDNASRRFSKLFCRNKSLDMGLTIGAGDLCSPRVYGFYKLGDISQGNYY